MSRKQRSNKKIHPRELQGKTMRQSFLIFCEGRTEVGYFNEFKKRAKLTAEGNALAIVQKAVAQKNAATKDVDQYWVVFDKDDATDENFNAAVQLAIKNNIQPAWSNQAFELWFILHYRSIANNCHRSQYEAILRNNIAAYDAGNKSEAQGKWLYEKTIPLIQAAINNARAGYNSFAANLSAAQKESSTKIFELIVQILGNSL